MAVPRFLPRGKEPAFEEPAGVRNLAYLHPARCSRTRSDRVKVIVVDEKLKLPCLSPYPGALIAPSKNGILGTYGRPPVSPPSPSTPDIYSAKS